MPALKRCMNYLGPIGQPGIQGSSGPNGMPGVQGISEAEMKEINRKKLIEERRKKIEKINKKYEK